MGIASFTLFGAGLLWASGLGCDGSGDSAADAAGSADAGDAAPDAGAGELPSGARLAAPAPPEPPRLTCADGWRSAGGACEPWPETGAASCADDEAHFPGEPGCARLGPACPADGWPEVPAGSGTVRHVRAGAGSGGDGSRAAPFATITEALASVTPATILAVAVGDYDEPVALPSGVTLLGACVSGTRLTHGTRTDAPATVHAVGTDVVVRNVSIAGARSGLLVEADATATIDDVRVQGATETGLRVHRGGSATLRSVVIRDTLIDPGDGRSAFGLVVELGGRAEASRMVVERNAISGVIVDGAGSELTLRDAVVRDTRSGTPAQVGVGVTAQFGAVVTLERIVIERSFAVGVMVSLPGTRAVVRDAVVRDTTDERGDRGMGMMVGAGAALVAERVLVERASYAGVFGRDSGSTLELADSLIRDTQPNAAGVSGIGVIVAFEATGTVARILIERARSGGLLVHELAVAQVSDLTVRDVEAQVSDGTGGVGIQAQTGGELTLARAHVERATSTGLMVIDGFARMRAEDVTVLDTRPQPEGALQGVGLGLCAQEQTTLDVERVLVSGSRGFGLVARGPDTELIARDLRIADTVSIGPRAPTPGLGGVGRGIDLQNAAAGSIERAIVERNRDVGVAVVGASRLDLRDAIVRDTESDEVRRDSGGGLMVIDGSQVVASDVRFSRNREVGVMAFHALTTVQLDRAWIEETRPNECEVDTCPERAAGIGSGAYDGAALTMGTFLVTRNALCGVQVAGGSVDLHVGEVSFHPVGANIQDPAFDVARLSDRVSYLENDTTLDSQTLPIPTPRGTIPVDM